MKKLILLSLLLCSVGVANLVAKGNRNLTVATYNIRNANSGDSINGNGWHLRCPAIVDLVKYHNFDIWGLQEVFHRQLVDLLDGLSDYASIGVGRDDGKTKGEYAPIFYKKDKFEVLQSGTFWLSTETDYPNKGWDAVLPRICSWAEFKDKANKSKIWFFNLHMDHVGVEARKESAKLVLKKIGEMVKKDEIVIFTGDFNVDQNNESYKLLEASESLKDSYEAAEVKYANTGTFNAFKVDLKTESRIDHIFVSPTIEVKRYGVLTDTYRAPIENGKTIVNHNFPKEVSLQEYEARLPSDHFPICVQLSY